MRLSPGGGSFAEGPFAQVAIACAASDTDATVLQMDSNLRELFELASAGREIPMELRLRTRRDQVREPNGPSLRSTCSSGPQAATRCGAPTSLNVPGATPTRAALHVADDVERALAM